MKVTLVQLECLRCGHKWFPEIRKDRKDMPRCCGWCKTPYWNIKPAEVSKTRKKHKKECETCRPKK